jgi:RNA polymerase sigma-70 factor (ECF subfamily)
MVAEDCTRMAFTDGELVIRAREQHMSAFQQLAERYKKKIYYTAYGVVKNRSDAEDIVQETLLQALRSLHLLRQPDGFGPWVLRIAYNRAVDIFRRRKREVLPEQDDDGADMFSLLESEAPAQDPQRMMESREITTIVRATLARLPESQRTAFTLKHVANLSIREIAEATSSSESTVKTNIYRAVQKLRADLAAIATRGRMQGAETATAEG